MGRRRRESGAQSQVRPPVEEDRWLLAVDGINDGIWDANLLTGEIFLSDRCLEILGFGPGEIRPSRAEWLARVHPDDEPAREAAMQEHLSGKASHYHATFRMRAKDGRYRWILSRGKMIRDEAGRAIRGVGSHSDVHAGRLAEEALRASEERFRLMFENSPVAIIECDCRKGAVWLQELRAGGVSNLNQYFEQHPDEFKAAAESIRITANDQTVRLLRAESPEHLQANMAATFTADAYETRRGIFLAIWEGSREMEGEMTLRAFDGSLVRVYFRWWLPHLNGEAKYEWTQIVLVDLTAIKHSEDALAAERERLKVMLSSMEEGVISLDCSGRVQYMNPAARGMSGWGEDAIGQPVNDVCVLRRERQGRRVELPLARVLSSGADVGLKPGTQLTARSGTTRSIEGRCAPLYQPGGEIMGVIFVFRDVMERSHLEAERLRTSKLESVGVLAGGIAHDFNNILTVVLGNLTLAMFDEQARNAAGRWLQAAERAALRARELTQQLLTFAKGGEPVRSAVLLPEVVQEAAQFALHGSNVKCEYALAAEAWPADADPGQIGRVIQNLVINAVQAMPDGGTIHLAVDNEPIAEGSRPPLDAGNYVRISIRDTGQGIQPENLDRIFDPYFTTKPQGSGLGLATAHSIVTKHQGHIAVHSTIGSGTTFQIWLPAARPVPASAPGTNSPFDLMRGKILLMDDEMGIREMAEAILRKLGLEVITVSDGAAAVQLYVEEQSAGKPFDLVVMDLTVPGGMGGQEATEKLREIDPGVRVIVSSGYSSDPIMSDYRAFGFCGCVAKPYRVKDFARTLREHLLTPTGGL